MTASVYLENTRSHQKYFIDLSNYYKLFVAKNNSCFLFSSIQVTDENFCMVNYSKTMVVNLAVKVVLTSCKYT